MLSVTCSKYEAIGRKDIRFIDILQNYERLSITRGSRYSDIVDVNVDITTMSMYVINGICIKVKYGT